MPERDLDQLFLAFRERGDLPALTAAFDRTSDELLTFALHLVSEPAQAEDLVQATFLTAIERAESYDSSRPFMPWLVGILARHAASARRERARGIDATRVETRVQLDPSDEIERAEVARVLSRAVDELPEPYRAAVKRHVIDGERAVDIARQSGIAAGTVRMHILRGLERLRRALPAGLFAAGPLSLRGTDAIRATVLDAARAKARILAASAGASTAAGISASIWTIGGLLVTTKILLGAGALVAAALFLWNITPATETPSKPLELASSKTESAPQPGLAESAPSLEAPRQSASAPSAPAAVAHTAIGGWWLSGTVSGFDDKAPEQTQITVRRIPGDALTCDCDKSGRFELDVSALFVGSSPKELLVSAAHPANRHGNSIVPVTDADVDNGLTARVDLRTELALAPYAVVTGHVAVPAGSGKQAFVQLDTAPRKKATQGVLGVSSGVDAAGRFEFRVDKPGEVVVRAACDGCLPGERAGRAILGESTDIGVIELLAGDVVIEGDVRLPFDPAHLHLGIIARRVETEGELQPGSYKPSEMLDGLSQSADVDENGHFRLTGIQAGTWQLSVTVGEEATMLWQEPVTCTAPGSGVVIGTTLGRLIVEVRSKDRPVPAARVLAHRADDGVLAITGADGRVTFMADMTLDLVLDPRAPGVEGLHIPMPAGARTPDMVQVIELPSVIEGKAKLVLEPLGPAPARAVIELRSPLSKNFASKRADLADGKYAFDDLVPGHWTVEVTPSSDAWYGMGGGEFLCNETFEVDLEADRTLAQPIHFVEGGRVKFEIQGWRDTPEEVEARAGAKIVDAQGTEIGAMFVVRSYVNDHLKMSASGRFPLESDSELGRGLLPGVYSITLTSDWWTAPPVSFRVVSGEVTTVRVPLTRR